MRLIQSHLDRWGVSRAEFSRRAGTTPQTIQNWQDRPGTMPKPEHLRGVAEVTGYPYLIVLDAALTDAGYRESLVDDLKSLKVRIARYVRSQDGHAPRGDLEDFLNTVWLPDDDLFVEQLDPDMSRDDMNRLIDRWIADADRISYGNDELFDRDLIRDFISDRLYDLRSDDDEADQHQDEDLDANSSDASGDATQLQPKANPLPPAVAEAEAASRREKQSDGDEAD